MNHIEETMLQADARKHAWINGQCYFCGILKKDAQYEECRLDAKSPTSEY